jgi:hypothetical protein
MKLRLLLMAVLTVAILFPVIVNAQDSPLDPVDAGGAILLGPVVGYNRSMHSVDLASFAQDPLCPFFTNGSSNGFHIGFFYEQILGEKTSQHSVVARVLYNSMPSFFEKVGDTYPSLVDDGNGGYTTVNSSTKHTVDVAYNMVSLDIMYKFRAVLGLVLTVGPTVDFIMKKELTQKYMIVEPDFIQFQRDPKLDPRQYIDNDRTIVVYGKGYGITGDGDIGKGGASSSTRFGLKLGAQYEIITGGKIDFIPGIFYNLGLTDAAALESWKVSCIQASVDIRFAI